MCWVEGSEQTQVILDSVLSLDRNCWQLSVMPTNTWDNWFINLEDSLGSLFQVCNQLVSLLWAWGSRIPWKGRKMRWRSQNLLLKSSSYGLPLTSPHCLLRVPSWNYAFNTWACGEHSRSRIQSDALGLADPKPQASKASPLQTYCGAPFLQGFPRLCNDSLWLPTWLDLELPRGTALEVSEEFY